MNWKKPIRFKVGDVPWEIPLHVLIMLIAITLVMMGFGAYFGFRFGSGTL
ncbi:hypothetical protein PBT90_19820 [Algoriphagus halophytocola]|uniref:Uncharacterized protein n=1 Tax=Algoriphagus halophytocola TaxID=2991499 RepID=A0ABY6MGK1_9BACT|nr:MULTISPECIES: hypothetical protein [unclassified Algoriphagus]UZD21766.1 hypothetical protein OM944_13955 [Algoriphagus sp. TR-M5]WBL42978.1 hypothetical protein PBT90_19820 [Algoriphagus sp. TR-M9]